MYLCVLSIPKRTYVYENVDTYINCLDYEESVDRSMEITGVLHKVSFRIDRTTNYVSSSCSTLFVSVGRMVFTC